jgi:hypothetical protein
MLWGLIGGSEISENSVGSIIFGTLTVIWGTTIIVLIPLRVFLDRGRVREMQRRVCTGEIDPDSLGLVQRHIFYANFGSLPKWMYTPFVIVALGLAAALVLAPVVMILLFLFTDVFGS